MQTIISFTKPSMSANFRNSKGFSLIEMAIVLVIIGVIIGAILKGQDLILNSRAKQVTATITTWRNLAAAYLDRNGRLPGDSGKSGRIGDTEITAGVNAITELENAMTNTPKNPVIVGGMKFWIYFGEITVAATPAYRNVIAVCKDATCATVFSPEELEVIKTVDTAIDGIADAGQGQFRAVILANKTLQAALANTAGGRAQGLVLAATAPIFVSEGGTSATWGPPAAPVHVAAVWTFDRPF